MVTEPYLAKCRRAGGRIDGRGKHRDLVEEDGAQIEKQRLEPVPVVPHRKTHPDGIGQVAKRNGGSNPFYTTVDLRLTKAFSIAKGHNLEFSADAFNFLNILNKEWGRNYNRGNTNLLNITGFDQAKQQYNYSVQNIATRPIGGTPWRIQLGVRYSFN